METAYELNVRDMLTVLEHQLASTEFDGHFEYVPYQEYDPQGDWVYSHIMSGYWANREAVHSFSSEEFHMLTRNFRIPLLKTVRLVVPC